MFRNILEPRSNLLRKDIVLFFQFHGALRTAGRG